MELRCDKAAFLRVPLLSLSLAVRHILPIIVDLNAPYDLDSVRVYAVPAIIFRRIEIILLTFSGRCRMRRRRRKRTTTMVVRTAALSESNRDHVFGCHKSHYRDGSVPSARRRVIVLLSVLFCRFRSARPEFRPDVDTHVCRSLFLSRTRCVFCVRRKKLHPTKIRLPLSHALPSLSHYLRCRSKLEPFLGDSVTQSALTFRSW